jgi:uncharacterized protein YacL
VRNADRFRLVVPFIEFRRSGGETGVAVLDASALQDARIPALARTGLLGHRLVVHQRTLRDCQDHADRSETGERTRVQRSISTLAELRAIEGVSVEIDQSELPQAVSTAEAVVELARLGGGRVVSSEREQLAMARAAGLTIIDLGALARIAAAPVHPGEVFTIRIERTGEGKGQGVGFLSDGTMVVVADAADRIGQELACVAQRLHHSTAGRMVFAERANG